MSDTGNGATIVLAEARHLGVPTGLEGVVLPNGHRVPTDLGVLLVRLTDGDGVTGQSMLWAQQDRQLPLFEASLRYFANQVEGHRLDETPNLPLALRRSMSFIGTQGVAAFGVSGLEMALEDLVCRQRNLSLAKVLGQTRDRIRAYQTGLMLHTSAEDLAAEAKGIYATGIKAVKMMVGKPSLDEDAERIAVVKASLPADASVMVDALQRWDFPDALRAAERFAEFGLVWLEDPLDHADFVGYRKLVQHSPVPIATGESLFSLDGFQQLIDAQVPYIIGELERVGGFRQWMRLADLAAMNSAVFLPHIYPHVSAQLVAALPQKEVWWEYVPWFDHLVENDFLIEDGYLSVSDGPGSGFNPGADAIDRFARTPWLRLTD